MQKSNVNACPHIGEWRHNIKTGSKTLFICPWCHDKLMERLADKEFLRGMIKSTMTLGEIVRMRREQAEDYAYEVVEECPKQGAVAQIGYDPNQGEIIEHDNPAEA